MTPSPEPSVSTTTNSIAPSSTRETSTSTGGYATTSTPTATDMRGVLVMVRERRSHFSGDKLLKAAVVELVGGDLEWRQI